MTTASRIRWPTGPLMRYATGLLASSSAIILAFWASDNKIRLSVHVLPLIDRWWKTAYIILPSAAIAGLLANCPSKNIWSAVETVEFAGMILGIGFMAIAVWQVVQNPKSPGHG